MKLTPKDRDRTRVAEPEASDDAVRAATGRDWNEWCDVLDAWPGHDDGHSAIAAYLQHERGVESWWAQTVTLGYERITGRRLPYQQPDGTFTVNASRTVSTDGVALRKMLLDDADRAPLFPRISTELRSRPTSKNVRITIGEGTAEIAILPAAEGRAKVVISHAKLPYAEDVDRWKGYWSAWLKKLEEGAAP